MYVYCADTYCDSCGERIKADLTREHGAGIVATWYDSDSYPQYAGEESTDGPYHCASVGECLEGIDLTAWGLAPDAILYGAESRVIGALLSDGLTEHGETYVRELLDCDTPTPYQTALYAMWREEFEVSDGPHFHVATGLAGYGPDGADGYATFWDIGSALDYAREELSTFVDVAHDGAHIAGDAGEFEDAWREVLRIEALELLRANLDSSRRSAPLYAGDHSAYASLQRAQADEFPHDVSHNTRLYLWRCADVDCDHLEQD